jgi:uncharacterized damage-inducible protein DinB
MDLKTIDDLYRFNRWANARVLESALTLGREEFVKTIASSFPSLRDTLVHMLWSEWIWLQRWRGQSPSVVFLAGDYSDAGALKSRWTELHAEQRDFLRTLEEAALDRNVRYVNLRGETWEYALWKQMLHVVNHSSYHRGQAATMLRQLDLTPPATDLLVFYDEGGR